MKTIEITLGIFLTAALQPGLADTVNLYTLQINTPTYSAITGPYPDYSFFLAILPVLQDEVAAGQITSFGWNECPDEGCPPIGTTIFPPPPLSPQTEPAILPEPASWMLGVCGMAVLYKIRKRPAR